MANLSSVLQSALLSCVILAILIAVVVEFIKLAVRVPVYQLIIRVWWRALKVSTFSENADNASQRVDKILDSFRRQQPSEAEPEQSAGSSLQAPTIYPPRGYGASDEAMSFIGQAQRYTYLPRSLFMKKLENMAQAALETPALHAAISGS